MSLLKDKFELQTVHEGKTLIEICVDAGDITSFDMCMQLLVDSKEPYINQETLGLIISSQEQETSKKFITDVMIVEAQFTEQAQLMLPLQGQI